MKNALSFAREVKEELVNTKFDKERCSAMLAGFIRVNGAVGFSSGETTLTISSQHSKTIKFFFIMIKELYGIGIKTNFEKGQKLSKNISYSLFITEQVDEILTDLKIDLLSDEIDMSYFGDENIYGGYLAGTFLASGSVNSPQNSNYHLELVTQYEEYAKSLRKLISRAKYHNFTPRVCARRNKYIVYIKHSAQVASFLVVMGAVNSCLEFEGIRVDRDYRNANHRLEMCDIANMKKTVDAGKEQVKIIKKLGLGEIKSEKARIVAQVRLDNPEASLLELSDILYEEYNLDISKSNLNHIFRSIKQKYLEK